MTATDAQGAVVDLAALQRLERQLELERDGRVHVTLRERLATLGDSEAIEVAFWLREPEGGISPRARIRELVAGVGDADFAEVLRTARADTLGWNIQRLAPSVGGFADAVRQRDGDVLVEGMGWPLVIASVRAGDVEALAALDVVDTAYVSQPEWAPEGDNAQGTMRTYNVHNQGVFTDGSVNVMVNDTTQVEVNNIYLPPVVSLYPLTSPGQHSTGVAGNIANMHPQYYASSYTLPVIYSAHGTGDVSAPNNWNAAISNGVDFGNCSWWNFLKGKIEFLDRFFDYTVRNYSVMMFKSNGNQGNTSTPYGTTPGNGYNVICTGNYNDANDADWANDVITASSSYWNPQEGHEKPEVASPGDCVVTTDKGPTGINSCFGGTSSASPLTCGVASLVTASDNKLLGQMTTVKAMLMASAWHNVEGAALLSDKDGAGGTHAKAAHALVRDQQWWYGDVASTDFTGGSGTGGLGGTMEVVMDLVAGDETRVIALWFSNASAAFSLDSLDMDLDMTVLDPAGAVVASSVSAVNPFELASFIPASSGQYRVVLTNQKFDGTLEPLTVAWSTRNDMGTAEISVDPSGPALAVGQTPTFTFAEHYLGAGADFAAYAALSGTSALPLGGGFAAPIAYDLISALVLGTPGWMGSLDAVGEASAPLPIPADPTLAGLPLHFGMIVWPAGSLFLGAPLSVSDDVVLVIAP